MFNWLKSWFRTVPKPKPEPQGEDGLGNESWTPEETGIYSYWNGERVIKADPLVLYKRVMAVGPELSIDMKVALSISKDAPVKQAEVAKRIRELFLVLPLHNEFELEHPDGRKTLTDTQVFELLDSFMGYCDNVKKNGRVNPTTQTETGSSGQPTDG